MHPDVPMADRHTFNLRENEVETVGKKERFRRNIMAIQLLKKCQEENRFATPEEQIVLSKYVGWGGLSEAFDENNSAWATEYLELSSVLTPEEYASARESTLTAFYTPPEVITAIYKAMEQMGFKEGNLLEPSCGIVISSVCCRTQCRTVRFTVWNLIRFPQGLHSSFIRKQPLRHKDLKKQICRTASLMEW